MSRLLLLFLLLAAFRGACAQSHGYVRDARTGFGLEGVHIYLSKDTVGVGITDRQGSFDLQFLQRCADGDTLVFSFVGYETRKMEVRALKKDACQVLLAECSQLLGQVTVTASERPYYLSSAKVTDMPKGLFSFGSCLADGKLYVVAGDETSTSVKFAVNSQKIDIGMRADEYRSPYIYVYDIAAGTWETKPHRVTERAGHTATFYNGRLFIIGGVRYSTNRRLEYTDEKLEIYDLAKDTLYVDPVNPHQALNFTSVVYDDLLYLIGGSKKQRLCWDKMHALDLKRGYWYEMGDIPKEYRREANGILVGHTVYFFGGSCDGSPSRDIYSCDLLSGDWKQQGYLEEGVIFPALAVQGDRIFVYEGNRLQVYYCRTHRLDAYTLSLGLDRAALHCWEGKLYVTGGYLHTEDGGLSPSSEIYQVEIGWLPEE